MSPRHLFSAFLKLLRVNPHARDGDVLSEEKLCFNCFYKVIRADNRIQETKGAVWKNYLI